LRRVKTAYSQETGTRNILQLLQKPLAYKKGWIVRMHAAQQCVKQIETKRNNLQLQSKETSRLYQWLAIHQSDHWSGKNKQKYKEIESETGTIRESQLEIANEENNAQNVVRMANGNPFKLTQTTPNKYQ
jgi:hypothetical protein